jgi:hypothetical protein
MTTPAQQPTETEPEVIAPPSWLDILGAAAVAAGFGAWGYKVNAEQDAQAALGPLVIAVWTAGFAAIRFASRRRILAGVEPTAHAAGVERAHAFAGAMLFTFLGVMSARNGQWLTAAGLIVAAVVFGLGGVRTKRAA